MIPPLKKTHYPFGTLFLTPEKEKLEKEKKSNPMKDYYPPSPVYTPKYEEDTQPL